MIGHYRSIIRLLDAPARAVRQATHRGVPLRNHPLNAMPCYAMPAITAELHSCALHGFADLSDATLSGCQAAIDWNNSYAQQAS